MEEMPELNKEAIENAIRAIEQADLGTITINELSKILEPLFIGYQTTVPIFHPPIHIFRGRACGKPTNLKDLVYPPLDVITTMGRANDIGEQVFYGSVGRGVPIAELNLKVGDTFMLSFWRTTDQILLNHIGFTMQAFAELDSSRSIDDLHQVYTFVEQTGSANELNQVVYNYLASVFTKSVEKLGLNYYKLSIAIAKHLMDAEIFDGIMFPTVARSAKAENVVLKRTTTDNKLKLVYVQFCEMTSISQNGDYNFDLLDTATEYDREGSLLWTGRSLSFSSSGNASFKYDNDDWFATDSQGNPLYPTADGELLVPLSPFERLHSGHMSKWIALSINHKYSSQTEVNIPVRIIIGFDLEAGERYFSCYVSENQNPMGLVHCIIQNHEKYTTLNPENAELFLNDNPKGTNQLPFKNKFIIFSCSNFDADELRNNFPNDYQIDVYFDNSQV